MENIEKIANELLCESLKQKIAKAPIPDQVELILDEDGNIEKSSVEFEKLDEIMGELAKDVQFSDVMSEDGIQTDVSMDVYIDDSKTNLLHSINDVTSIAKDIEDEIEPYRVSDPVEFGSGFADLKVQTSNYSFDPTNARFKIEWIVENAEGGSRKRGPTY